MSYPICSIKNISEEVKTLNGKEFQIDEVYQIPDLDRISWATSDFVITAITDDLFQIYDNFGAPIESYSNQIDHLKNY